MIVIAILVLNSLSCKSQGIELVNKGFILKYDSAVMIPLLAYRQTRTKLITADTLIIGLRQEVKELNTQISYYQVKDQALKGSNQILTSQNKELRKANADIMGKYEEAVKTKWFKSPLLYSVSGLVLGFLLFN